MLRFKDLPQFERALTAAVHRKLEERARPVLKGIVYEAAKAFIEGGFGYAGTPQWKGNAAANWHITEPGQVAPYIVYFEDPPAPGEAGYEGPSKYSAKNPRLEALQISLNRVEGQLKNSTAMRLTLVNSAPQLGIYTPYADDGTYFRMENHWPLSPGRLVGRLAQRARTLTAAEVAMYRERFG